MLAHEQIESGWLLCDGSAVSREQYSELFKKVGTLWGAGNGTTTFNLPPSGVCFVNIDPSSVTNWNTVGQTGGSVSGSVSVSGTTGAGSSHSHGAGSYQINAPGAPGFAGGGANAFPGGVVAVTGTSGAEASHTHSFSGSGTASTIQPYACISAIICYTNDLTAKKAA